MNRAMFSTVLFTLLAHSCTAEIAEIVNNMEPEHVDRLVRAAVDIAMTCYGDPGTAIGIVDDRDGLILKAIRLNHFIPVVLVNQVIDDYEHVSAARLHKLQVFVVAAYDPEYLRATLFDLQNYVWWNQYANFLFVDMSPEVRMQCSGVESFMLLATLIGILNVQLICQIQLQQGKEIIIWNSNPFIRQAPKVWKFVRESKFKTNKVTLRNFLFGRLYRESGQSCESINFEKTINVGGYPLRFVTDLSPSYFKPDFDFDDSFGKYWADPSQKKLVRLMVQEHRSVVNTLVNTMHATAQIADTHTSLVPGLLLRPRFLSTHPSAAGYYSDHTIISLNQASLYTVTQHTNHMTQLDKILSVIDRDSRIGMLVVYFITFLFFKFFLGQPVIPALLNIVRLTSNTGLTTLPQNVAPTFFLTSLFIFVIIFQAIFTGNLATLLTTVIPYPNVQTRGDVAKLGYKIYMMEGHHTKLSADPVFDGCVIEVPILSNCVTYVLRDPLAACIMDQAQATAHAGVFKLHVSKDPMAYEYSYYVTTLPNILKRRIEKILTTVFEAGLHRSDEAFEMLRIEVIDDDEVKQNKARRVITFADLRFAFVILGIGLLCSLTCFIGEVVISTIRLKYAKRRDRVRRRFSWDVTAKKCSLFPSLSCRFRLRRLFSNRR